MNPIIRNVLAVIAGLIVCMFTNGMVIGIGSALVAPPDGVNPNDLKSIVDNIDKYEPKHFAVPFLAHALGSLVGAATAAAIAATRKKTFALVIGGVHMFGGVTMVILVGGPLWFIVLDLGVAYLPAAWVGGWSAAKLVGVKSATSAKR